MIIYPHQKKYFHQLGGKAEALAKLAKGDFNIPAWFAVTEDDDSEAQEYIEAAKKLKSRLFAVRSSAIGEDGSEHSFAGQYDTFLYVPIAELASKIQQVQKSSGSEHLQTYQKSKKIAEIKRPTALVQRMLHPSVSGVAFSADPITGDIAHTVISAVWGAGSALVSGEADADAWTIDLTQKIIQRNIADKLIQHEADFSAKEGVRSVATVKKNRTVPCLDDLQIQEVAKLARACADYFNCPQDIEWAYEDGILYLLQSRPITTLTNNATERKQEEPLTIWDNSNIAESYSGITSPLTFTFAERIYEHVYREFCKLLSVPDKKITANDHVFPKMLGHIKGHVYYNLNSWYHVLAMLPGFSINRSFMEQMMGVKEPMPDEVVHEILRQTQESKAKDAWALTRTLIGLIKNQRTLPRQIKRFYKRLNQALESPETRLSEMSSAQLTSHYHYLESQLLKQWDAPLVNDFFAMIYYGVLKSLCEKWLNDASLQNTLLLDAGEIISAEPPKLIHAMAAICSKNLELSEILADSNISSKIKIKALSKHPQLYEAYEAYLEKFGDRCLEELKLESPTVGDNPQSLLTGIGVMAKRLQKQTPLPNKTEKFPTPEISLSKIKLLVFNWVLKQAKNRVRDRENLRFERTRLFGRVRKIMVELGKRLHSQKILSSPSDIFFLTIQEALAASENNANFTNLHEIANERKTKQEAYTVAPPDRFETRGKISDNTVFIPTSSANKEPSNKKELSGTGACPGIVRGKVKVVKDPRHATLEEGEILVAQQTDPGWVVLFPAAAGLLVERGSLLSHSAIVARELQLPCIVSIPQITSRLQTGDIVEMNGSSGEIKILLS